MPVVDRPSSPGAFPGLYASGFVGPSPFASDTVLLVTSSWFSQTVLLAVDVTNGRVTPVTPTEGELAGSWTLQGVCAGVAAAVLSRPAVPPVLMMAAVPASPAEAGGACFTKAAPASPPCCCVLA